MVQVVRFGIRARWLSSFGGRKGLRVDRGRGFPVWILHVSMLFIQFLRFSGEREHLPQFFLQL